MGHPVSDPDLVSNLVCICVQVYAGTYVHTYSICRPVEFIIPGPLVVSLLHSGIKAQVFGLSMSYIAPGFEVYYVKFIHNHLDIHNSYNTIIACVYSGIDKVGTGRTQAQQFSLVSK